MENNTSWGGSEPLFTDFYFFYSSSYFLFTSQRLWINCLNVLLSCFIIKQIECTFANVQSCGADVFQERLFYHSICLPVDRCAPLQPPSRFSLFPVQHWEHKEGGEQRQDNGVLLFRVFVSEGLMFPHYLQFPRGDLSCLCFGLETSLSVSAQWVPGGGAEMSPGMVLCLLGWLSLGKCHKRSQTKADPSFSSSVTFAVCGVEMRGQPGFGVTLSSPGSCCLTGGGWCIPFLTDFFQFNKKIMFNLQNQTLGKQCLWSVTS